MALGVFSFSRIATWLFPFDSDHWVFYYIGRRWSEGSTLYLDMWDHKSPLIYGYNSILHWLFGNNIVLHRIFFTVIALLSLWLFYKTAKLLYTQLKLKNAVLLARISTLAFAFLTNLAVFTNSGNNNENIGLLFLTVTIYAYLRWRTSPDKNKNYLLLSSLGAGFVIMLKINFFVLLLPILVDLIIISRKSIYRLISNIALAFLGILLQALMWVIYFTHVGTLKQFYIATIQFNGKYMGALGWDISAPGILIFIGILGLLLLFFAPFIIKSGIKLYKNKSQQNLLIALMSLCALVFMVLAGTFYSHYFLIALPLLCLVLGATYSDVAKFKPKLLLAGYAIVVLLMLASSFKQLYNSYSGSVKAEANNQVAVAEYIKEHTNKDDTFFANVYGATMYRLAERNSGTRFISASHPLIDYKHNLGYDFNLQFITDMVYSEAKYVVISSDPDDLYIKENDVLTKFINNNYTLETTIGSYNILVKDSNY